MAEPSDAPPGLTGGFRRLWARGHKRAQPPAGKGLAPHDSAHPLISAAQLQVLFAHADTPPALVAAFANGLAGLGGELRGMGQRLQAACADGDWNAYGRAMRQLIDKYIRTIPDEPVPGSGVPSESEQLRGLLHHTLVMAVETLLREDARLHPQTQSVADQLKDWQPGQPLAALDGQLRELCHAIGQASHETRDAQELLRSLFDLLLENVGELLEDGSWLQDQIAAARSLLSGPLDRERLEETRSGLREVIYKQGLLKQGLDESKAAMKDMMVTFVERLDGMASSTGEFHDRISFHAQAVRDSRSIAELGKRMEDILEDTAQLQRQALRARDDLCAVREEAEAAERRVASLEQELQSVSNLVRIDQLTEALNRRGFEELFRRESSRALRSGQPLCLALLDLDDFRLVNATHGHLGGDAALRHVVAVVRGALRGSDAIGRFGGEEFVLLLPDTSLREAEAIVARALQRLAQRPLLHEGERLAVTFSAGVAPWRAGETQDALVERADRAMYEAKAAGKNRVMAARD
ncbi:GGDEF domain-containing protein [Pseudomonas sp. R2.Fl]|nr:GGDEF domain-containing protein [Pseudomonas sp. R2.Fl]